MGRTRGAQTLELSVEDNAALLLLCADNHDAEKKWLGGVYLRYGMSNSALALAAEGKEGAVRTRKRRESHATAAAVPAPPKPAKP